jgi:deoxycytidylate deaminase
VLITGGLDGLATGSINTAELFDPATQTFTAISPMNEPRAFHSSTLLPSGDVLITGGTVSLAAISSTAELFNPTANTFTTVTNMMVQPRYSHTATLLPSGQILLAGGVNNGSLATNTAELCDPTAGAENFRSLLPTTMNSARYNTAATLLPDGNVLITGGADQQAVLNTAELFNPSSETFAVLANTMNSPRFIHSATLLGNGKVLIAGGYTNQPSNTAELFDPGSETFTSVVSTMTTPRYWHSATLLPNGKVLLAGGYNGSGSTNSADLFDPASATFVSLPPMHFARQAHSATLLEDGKVLIAGGYTLNGATNSAELFDPVSETFTLLSPNTMSVPRFYHTATLLPSGQVLLTGGSTGSGFSNTAELFDPVSQTFTALSNTMKLSRYWHTAAQLSTGKVLIVGGYSDAGASLPLVITNTAELFDPATETFTLVSSTMSNGRANGNTATLLANGEVLVAGGLDGNTIAAETANNTADLFDSGLGFSDAERPVVSTVSSPLFLPVHFALTGSGFQGDSEASDSSYSASATNYPLLQLTRIDNEQSFFVFSDPSNPWSARSFSSQTLSSLPTGFYRLKVFANAIPSLDQLISIKTAPPAQLTGVVSRKSHGNAATFDVDLTAGDGIECRSGGANGDYTLVFSFTNTLTGVVNAGVTTGVGSVATSNIDSNDAHNYIVNLTGVANAEVITVSLSDVSDSAGDFSPAVSIQMAILLGDVNSSRRVDAADVSLVRQQTLQPLTSSNFRADINTSGRIDAADVSIARQQTLTSVP